MCSCMFSGRLPLLRCADEPPEYQRKTKGEETKQTPKSVCHLCSHTVHTCHEYSGTETGPGKCWSGAWPILLGQTPTLPCLILLPLSCAVCGHILRRQGCTTARKPPLSERGHEKEMQPDFRNGFKGEK